MNNTFGKVREERADRREIRGLWADVEVFMDWNFGKYKVKWKVRLDWE